jgi:26S proteasome regulatory subunit N9
LNAFNSGNIPAFEQLLPVIQQESLLIENMVFLQQKIRLMALIEIIFHLSADKRNLSFDRVAEGTRLPADQVELLLMKAMSLKLIKGIIDQVEAVVSVTWIQPRVLDKTQIAALGLRMQEWNQGVNETMKKMLSQTPELYVQ